MTGAEGADAELQWGEEAAAPPRRRIPSWAVWSCGSGCLLFTVVLALFVFTLWRFSKAARDPEQAWPALALYLPFDQRPEGWDIEGGELPLVDMAMFSVRAPDGGELRVQSFDKGQFVEHALDPDSPQNQGVLDSIAVLEPEAGTITLQGREVPCLRFRAKDPGVEQEDGIPTLRFEGARRAERFVLIEVRSTGPARLPDERASELLGPFDLWSER